MIRFISDLHLSPKRPQTIRAFFSFLNNCKNEKITSLYILGDFFEYWIGDDFSEPWIDEVKAQLSSCEKDFPIFFMAGNRDFTLGKRFATQSKVNLLDEPKILNVANKTILLMHGDLLCTQDTSYLTFRKVIRNPFILFILKCLPLKTRLKLAHNLREGSSKSMQAKPKEIMDATHEGVLKYSKKYDCDLLIHGHTHRPNIHPPIALESPASQPKQSIRITLGDWSEQAYGLEIEETTGLFNLIDFYNV